MSADVQFETVHLCRTATAAGELERRVIDASAGLFAFQPFQAVRLIDIARAADVPLADLMTQFSDQREILGTIMDQATDTLFWFPLPQGDAPGEVLSRLAQAHLRALHDNHDLALAVARNYEWLEDPYRTSFRQRAARYRRRWLGPVLRLTPGLPPARMDPVVMAMLDVLNAGPVPTSIEEADARAASFASFAMRTYERHPTDVRRVFHAFAGG